jgi:hypothetical protein
VTMVLHTGVERSCDHGFTLVSSRSAHSEVRSFEVNLFCWERWGGGVGSQSKDGAWVPLEKRIMGLFPSPIINPEGFIKPLQGPSRPSCPRLITRNDSVLPGMQDQVEGPPCGSFCFLRCWGLNSGPHGCRGFFKMWG